MWQSLVQSSSSCCFIVVSGTIIIVVEPWYIVCNERRFLWGIALKGMIHFSSCKKKSSTPGGRRQLATIIGNVLPMPVGRLLRMWWPSSALMAAATISACNGSRVHAVGVVVLLITWKSRRTSGKAGWVSRSCWYAPRTFSLASNRRGSPPETLCMVERGAALPVYKFTPTQSETTALINLHFDLPVQLWHTTD